MKKKKSDRSLLLVARNDIKWAKLMIKDPDEISVNKTMFHISQAAEKMCKFLCSCYDIDYEYSHYVKTLLAKLENKQVVLPQLVVDSADMYGTWATQSRYASDQMAIRSTVQKHLDCVEEWLMKIEKDFGFDQLQPSNVFGKNRE